MISLSQGQLKIVKAVGYPTFFVVCYCFFLALTFPAQRFIPMAERQLSALLGRDVSIENMSISPFGSLALEGVTIGVPQDETALAAAAAKEKLALKQPSKRLPTKKGKAAQAAQAPKPIVPKYRVKQMQVDVGIWAFLMGEIEVDVEMDFLGGNIQVAYKGALPDVESEKKAELTPQEKAKRIRDLRSGKVVAQTLPEDEESEMMLSFVAKDLNLIQFWDLKDFLPLPMFGKLDFGIELQTTTGKFKDATGKMWVNGRGISLGQGQSKIDIQGLPMTVDAMTIQSLVLEVIVKEGKSSFSNVQLVSTDLDATAEGTFEFADPFALSLFNLYFTFKLLDGYGEKSSSAKNLVAFMPSAVPLAKRPDGYMGFVYNGRLKTAKFRPLKAFNSSSSSRASQRRRGVRASARARTATRPQRPTMPARPTPIETPALPPQIEPEPPPPEPDLPPVDIEIEEPKVGEPQVRTHAPPGAVELSEQYANAESRRTSASMKAMADAKAKIELEEKPAVSGKQAIEGEEGAQDGGTDTVQSPEGTEDE